MHCLEYGAEILKRFASLRQYICIDPHSPALYSTHGSGAKRQLMPTFWCRVQAADPAPPFTVTTYQLFDLSCIVGRFCKTSFLKGEPQGDRDLKTKAQELHIVLGGLWSRSGRRACGAPGVPSAR